MTQSGILKYSTKINNQAILLQEATQDGENNSTHSKQTRALMWTTTLHRVTKSNSITSKTSMRKASLRTLNLKLPNLKLGTTRLKTTFTQTQQVTLGRLIKLIRVSLKLKLGVMNKSTNLILCGILLA